MTLTKNLFAEKEQVAYVPSHATSFTCPDIEFGFVVKPAGLLNHYFVRYWNKDLAGLRTKANSEASPVKSLVPLRSVPDSQVEVFWKKYVEKE